jgi:hypothetical protein
MVVIGDWVDLCIAAVPILSIDDVICCIIASAFVWSESDSEDSP